MKDLLVAILALCALAGVAYGGWWLLTESDVFAGEQRQTADPAETVAAFAAAWEAGDHDEVEALTREAPDTLVATYDQVAEGLEYRELRVRPGETEQVEDGRARTPVAVTAVGEDYGEVEWQVELELLRERGQWGVTWSPTNVHPSLREGMVFEVVREEVERAPILAAGGEQLAGEGDQVTFGFDPGTVEDRDDLAEAFEEAVEGAGEAVDRIYARGNLVDGWFYPVVTLPADRTDDARDALRGVRGALSRSISGRTLLDEGFAQHVVGRVDEATREQLDALGDPYEPGDEVGQFGLEAVFEADLAFATRVQVVLRERPGGPAREVLAESLSGAEAVQTTIDARVQRAVENALIGVDEEAAIVVIDTGDGAIRASASRPLSGYNRAFEGRYPPGSTFKIVTAEALLAGGLVPETDVGCPERAVVGGLSVTNAGGRELGDTTLEAAFANSCNTTFAGLAAEEVGIDGLTDAAERFGFGVEPDLPLPAFGGSFPEPADTAELAAAAFGQARVEVSPLHLASMAAAARSGVWRPPYLMAADEPGDARQLSGGTLDGLRRMLRAVITDGNGEEAEVAGTDSQVEGKTGTAQAGGDVEHAWFAGSWGEYGFAVLVEGGGAGSEVAAPIAGRLVDELQVQLAEDG
ncbi:penicillin-binding transpeptidase domain-containing protein [Egicoccus sp. AB-alg2]|uniref:penicillin-binding transpeptidase domain-containing protein n=1 Tax=Egicoccus sp. AB-alg2 TaxID=3242693 RepID=UPI00359D27A3